MLESLLGLTGLSGTELAGVLALVSLIARLIGKAIPDTATGVLALVRKLAKVVGLYVSNRIDDREDTDSIAAKTIGR